MVLFKNKRITKSELHKLGFTEANILEIQDSQTLMVLLPLWTKNVYDNQPYIKKYGNTFQLLCKTYPKCYRLDILKEIFFSRKEHSMKQSIAMSGLPKNIIENAHNFCLTDNAAYAGTNACNNCKNKINVNKPALIISGGPSLDTYKHLELLKHHTFNGDIFCVSSVLKNVLEHGVIPKYFNSLDSEEYDTSFVNNDIVSRHTNDITGLFSVTVHPTTNEVFNGNRYFYNPYNPGYNISHIFYLQTRTPTINTGGNVGTCTAMLAAALGYNPIILIGMDLSFQTFDEMKQYYKTNVLSWNPTPKRIPWNKGEFYKILYNPIYKKEYYVDTIYEMYSNAANAVFKSLKNKSKFINCSEQGSLYNKDILNIRFEEYLKNQDKYNDITQK